MIALVLELGYVRGLVDAGGGTVDEMPDPCPFCGIGEVSSLSQFRIIAVLPVILHGKRAIGAGQRPVERRWVLKIALDDFNPHPCKRPGAFTVRIPGQAPHMIIPFQQFAGNGARPGSRWRPIPV